MSKPANLNIILEQEIVLLEKELESLYRGFLFVRKEHNDMLLNQLNIKKHAIEEHENKLDKLYSQHVINALPVYTKIFRYRKQKLLTVIENEKEEIKILEKEFEKSVNVDLDEFNTRKIQNVKWKIVLAKQILDKYSISGEVSIDAITALLNKN